MVEQWYVIEAFQGAHEDAYLKLAAAGFHVWRPIDVVRVNRNVARRSKGVDKSAPRRDRKVARFGRFLFLRAELNDYMREAVVSLSEVRRFLCFAGTTDPAPLPEDVITFNRDNTPKYGPHARAYKRGQTVNIIAGPFAEQKGMIESVDDRGIVVVMLAAMGRSIPVPIQVEHVSLSQSQAKPPGRQASDEVAKHRERELAQSA